MARRTILSMAAGDELWLYGVGSGVVARYTAQYVSGAVLNIQTTLLPVCPEVLLTFASGMRMAFPNVSSVRINEQRWDLDQAEQVFVPCTGDAAPQPAPVRNMTTRLRYLPKGEQW